MASFIPRFLEIFNMTKRYLAFSVLPQTHIQIVIHSNGASTNFVGNFLPLLYFNLIFVENPVWPDISNEIAGLHLRGKSLGALWSPKFVLQAKKDRRVHRSLRKMHGRSGLKLVVPNWFYQEIRNHWDSLGHYTRWAPSLVITPDTLVTAARIS